MITLKSPRELSAMRRAGLVVHEALDLVRRMSVPGRKTIEIDRAAETGAWTECCCWTQATRRSSNGRPGVESAAGAGRVTT